VGSDDPQVPADTGELLEGEVDLIERTAVCTYREKLGSLEPPGGAITA